MNRLPVIIIIAMTLIVSGVIIYKIINGNSTNVEVVSKEGKKELTREELAEIEKRPGMSLPGQYNPAANTGLPEDVNRHQQAINQVEQINRLNERQR
ncbi:hypothetical protein KAR34_00810 [bacterium]|nr:hypothetical protein [bacterium]